MWWQQKIGREWWTYIFEPRRYFKEKKRVGRQWKIVYYKGQYIHALRTLRISLGQGKLQREITIAHETIHAAIPCAPEMQVENAAQAIIKALRSARKRGLID